MLPALAPVFFLPFFVHVPLFLPLAFFTARAIGFERANARLPFFFSPPLHHVWSLFQFLYSFSSPFLFVVFFFVFWCVLPCSLDAAVAPLRPPRLLSYASPTIPSLSLPPQSVDSPYSWRKGSVCKNYVTELFFRTFYSSFFPLCPV